MSNPKICSISNQIFDYSSVIIQVGYTNFFTPYIVFWLDPPKYVLSEYEPSVTLKCQMHPTAVKMLNLV